MDPKDLGERVDPNNPEQVSSAPIHHTGLQLPYPGQPGSSYAEQAKAEKEAVMSPAMYGSAFQPPPQAPKPQAQQQQPTGGPVVHATPQVQPPAAGDMSSARESATIQKLREKFGVKSIPVKHFPAGDFKWTFRVPGKTDVTWVITLMQDLFAAGVARSEAQAGMLFKTGLMCMSIAAIDDVPVYQHFAMDIGDRIIQDPMFPPRDVRCIAARMLYDVLSDDILAPFVDDLETFFTKEIEPLIEERVKGPLAQKSQQPTSSSENQNSPSATNSPG